MDCVYINRPSLPKIWIYQKDGTMTDFNTVFENQSNSVKFSLFHVYTHKKTAHLFVPLNEND